MRPWLKCLQRKVGRLDQHVPIHMSTANRHLSITRHQLDREASFSTEIRRSTRKESMCSWVHKTRWSTQLCSSNWARTAESCQHRSFEVMMWSRLSMLAAMDISPGRQSQRQQSSALKCRTCKSSVLVPFLSSYFPSMHQTCSQTVCRQAYPASCKGTSELELQKGSVWWSKWRLWL